MLGRISLFCVALVVAITGVLDVQTAEAQLFRRLRNRIESAIQTPPPAEQQTQPGTGAQQPTPATPRGQRVAPVGPTTADSANSSAFENKYGKSILAPSQSPQPSPNRTPEKYSPKTQNDAFVGNGSSATNRPSLGIEVVPSPGPIAGLKVVRIKDSSSADDAGLQLDDVIVAVEGAATPTIPEIAELLRKRKSGDVVRTEILRGRTRKVVMLRLMENTALAAKPSTSLPTQPQQASKVGIEIKASNVDRGVIVTDVAKNSPADAAGLQVGDRIVSVDGRLLLGASALDREFVNLKTGDEISLQIVRNKKLVSTDVKMVDPGTLAKSKAQQPAAADKSVLGGFGSVFGGLFGGNAKPKALAPTKAVSADAKDEMAFGDDEPIQQVGFESETKSQEKGLKGDPPSLEALELPPGEGTPIELDSPKQQAPQSSEELREEIRRLKQQLKDLEAGLKADSK